MKLALMVLVIVSLALAGVATFVTYKINERRFKRLNAVGLQTFPTYRRMLVIRWSERIGMWVARPLKVFFVMFAIAAAFMWWRLP